MPNQVLPEVINEASEYLKEQDIPNPRWESEVLLGWVLGLDRMGLYTGFQPELDSKSLEEFRSLLARRGSGWPLQYLMGEAQFMGLDFEVKPGVFIPRSETEILVEAALEKIATRAVVFDLGTGCGNIAVSIAKFLDDVWVFASDISSLALGVAALNARRHEVDKRVRFLAGEFFKPLGREKVDFVLSNPPYIRSDDLGNLLPEVRCEPKIALDGGKDGLQVLKKIVEDCPPYLKESGYLILEVADTQAHRVSEIIRRTKQFLEPELIKDYNQIERIVIARKAVSN